MGKLLLKSSQKSIALLMVFVMMLSLMLSGCDVKQLLQDLATDYVWVIVANDEGTLLSESDNNEQIYTYQIDASVTNGYFMDLPNAVISLNVPNNVEISKQGDKQSISEKSIGVEKTLSYSWIVKIPMNYEDQNIEYSISVVSDVSSNVETYGSLYVEGKNTEDNRLEFNHDIWNFKNFDDVPVALKQADYDALMIGWPNTYRQKIKEWIPNNGNTGGYCFGMSSLTILTKMHRLKSSDICAGSSELFDISKNETSKSVIGYYHISQISPSIQEGRANFIGKSVSSQLSDIERMCENVKTGGAPVLLDLYIGANFTGGHTVVAYSAERGKFTKCGKNYDSRILIYDCNNKKIKWDEDYCLYYNQGTSTWCIPNYPNASGFMGAFSNVNDIDFKNIVANRKSANAYITSRTEQDLTIYNSSGEYFGKVSGATVDTDKIVVYRNTGGVNGDLTIAIPNEENKENNYVIVANNPKDSVDLSIMYDNYYLSAESNAQESVCFSENGDIKINGKTSDFNIQITANEGYYSTDWYQISVSGDSGTDPKLEVTDKGYILSGKDLSEVTVYAENEKTAGELNLKTDEETVLITQDGENLCVKSDEDQDGEYETVLVMGSTVDPHDPTGGSGGSGFDLGSLFDFGSLFQFGGTSSSSLWIIALVFGLVLVAVIAGAAITLCKPKKEKDETDVPIVPERVLEEQKEEPKEKSESEESEKILNGIRILTGSMEGRNFEFEDGKTYTVGKDSNLANVQLDASYTSVSRLHCTITYQAKFDKYFVTDCSANGIFYENGTKLAKNARIAVPRGVVLKLADDQCKIALL